MIEPDPRLRDYHFDSFWTGTAYVPFWGKDLPIWFHTYAKQPSPRQLRILGAILDYQLDLRASLERSVFDYYQAEVFGCIDFGCAAVEEECAPHLTEASQIWKLIPGADIWISYWHKDGYEHAIEFKMTFACSWDEEHGFGVKFRDWKIVGFGGAVS
jgi:hypothetical protein